GTCWPIRLVVSAAVVPFASCNVFCFFFQAEDGIRDRNVTGVQTCALPISTTSETPTASTSLSATTYTNSTPSSPNHSPQTKPTKSPPASTNGSPPNPACGQTDQPSTKQPSPPSRQHADAKVANLEDLINEKRCLISSRKANCEHSVQTSSKWVECPRTRRKSGSITPKYHQLDV